MTPLRPLAIHWNIQDIVGLYCIRFSPVCFLKARMSGSPLLLLLPMLEFDCDCL